jgi:ABC-type enterobactin transport system permease subunit
LIRIKRIILRGINLDQRVMFKPQELYQWMNIRSITTMKAWKKKRYCLINWRYRRIIVYLNLMKAISKCSLWLDLKLSFTISMNRWVNGKLGVGNVSKEMILNFWHAWKINI